jgi:hypothetical protein
MPLASRDGRGYLPHLRRQQPAHLWAIVIGYVVDFGDLWQFLDMLLGNAGDAPADGVD